MKKVLINTNYRSAGSKVCVDDLSIKFRNAGFEIKRNDWNNYQEYDLVLFMSPDSEAVRAKKINPDIRVGIMDPKINMRRKEEVKTADFLIVSSIEQKDIFLKYNKNIFIYYMFPEIKEIFKEHTNKDKTIIAYHGNKLHLSGMLDVAWALDELSNKYNIELWIIYNIEKLGKWKNNLFKRCPLRHIQWSEENYYKYLSQSDIGIMPNKKPINLKLGLQTTKLLKRFLGYKIYYNKYDYLMRFKYSSNPGRIYVFSQLYIPVVADFTPSCCQVIQDGKSGLLVYSKEGWYQAIEQLILEPDLRQKMSINLKEYIDNNCSPEINFQKLLKFIENLKK